MNQKCPKEPTVLPQNHDSSCGESRQQRSHMRWFGSWQRCCLGHIPCSQNENLWQWFAPHQRPLLVSDGPTYWAALARQSPSHGNPWLPTLLQGTLAHPGTPWHTLTYPEKCLWPWISMPLALTCPEHSNLSLEVLALWPAAQHHRAGFHHCSSPWFQVFRSSLLSCVIVLLCVNYHN